MQGRVELGRAKQGRTIAENSLCSPKRTKSQLITCLPSKFGKNAEHEKKKFCLENHIILRNIVASKLKKFYIDD